MSPFLNYTLYIALLFTILSGNTLLLAKDKTPTPTKVELREFNSIYRLYVENEPFFVKGAGGQKNIPELAAAGANTLRTWSSDNLGRTLELAEQNGLKVAAGIWITHERHGFDYDDEVAVQLQIEQHKKTVNQFKDHPALLLWFVGNEVGHSHGNPKVWDCVESVAAYIKQVDSNHPVGTVTAGVNPNTYKEMLPRCPSLDLLGVNVYSAIGKVGDDLKRSDWNKPYMITEWGPTGHWESDKTSWGASIEQTSTEKAEVFAMRYKHILEERDKCLGSFVFYWGQKQETTSTWYGVFTKRGRHTEVVDRMTFLWSNQYPEHRSPRISNFTLNGVLPTSSLQVHKDHDGLNAEFNLVAGAEKSLTVEWMLFRESTDLKSGGDHESEPEKLPIEFAQTTFNSTQFSTPDVAGAYRLFLFVKGQGNTVATANFPFLVLK